ncbi:hypothetical protein B0H12DRAFT_1107936 [Mycena haematopus]|nr:hypothetical protein B0H12DRAFT_1107936 [Mycena haematopus]
MPMTSFGAGRIGIVPRLKLQAGESLKATTSLKPSSFKLLQAFPSSCLFSNVDPIKCPVVCRALLYLQLQASLGRLCLSLSLENRSLLGCFVLDLS